MPRAVAIAVALTSAASPCLAAELSARDPASLRAALDRAKAGDVISIAPGDYGELDLSGRAFTAPVKLIAANPAARPQFRKLKINAAKGLVLESLIVRFGPSLAPLKEYAVEITNSSGVVLRKSEIASAANGVAGDDAFGVYVREARGVTIETTHIHDAFRGVAAFDSDAVVIRRNRFTKMGSDGVVARGMRQLAIEGNYFSDFDLVDKTRFHPDAVQVWSRGAARANEDIVIRGNVIRRDGGDASQGIFISTPELETRRLLIEDNVVCQSMGQGIFVSNAADVVVRRNTIAPAAPVIHTPAITLRAPLANITSEYNLAAQLRYSEGVQSRGDVTADFDNPFSANHIGKLLAGGARLAAPEDFAPLTEAGAVNFVKENWLAAPQLQKLTAPAAAATTLGPTILKADFAKAPPASFGLSRRAASTGGEYFHRAATPDASIASDLTIDVALRLSGGGESWGLIAGVAKSYEAKVKGEKLVFIVSTQTGANARLDADASGLADGEVHQLSFRYRGAGDMAILMDGAVIARGAAPKGPINPRPRQALTIAGAPWGLILDGAIERISIRR